MTTIAVSTLKMAQSYADRSNLQYDHKEYPFGGGEFVCYDDAGEPIQKITYYAPPTEVISRTKYWEYFNPNANRFEEFRTLEDMAGEIDLADLHIPYESERTIFADGSQIVIRRMMTELSDLPFSSELVKLQLRG